MSKVKIYNLEGKVESEKTLSEIFSVEMNQNLLSQAVVAYQANRRNPISHTKDRGDVSGGGRKPFKQKGTGNARAGSNRSPLWIGGGVTFGPRNTRNYTLRINKKMNQKAIRIALSEKVAQNKLIVLKSLTMDKISTSGVYALLSKLPIEEGKILVILPKLDANLELSFSNIPYAKVIKANNLNVFDLLKYDYILTSIEGIEAIDQILSGVKVVK